MTLAPILRVAALTAALTSGWLAGCSSSSSDGCSTSSDCGGEQNSCYGDYVPGCICELSSGLHRRHRLRGMAVVHE